GGTQAGAGVPALVAWGGETADRRAGMRLRGFGRLGAGARLHQHDWFAGRARAAAGGEELLRSANLLAVDRDHAGRAVVSQEFEEIGGFEPRLIAGRDDVGQRKRAP